MEKFINLHIEKLPEGYYLATCDAIQGLVAQGRTLAEKLSAKEAEEIGLYYSIKEGLESGLMVEEDKTRFMSFLEDKK